MKKEDTDSPILEEALKRQVPSVDLDEHIREWEGEHKKQSPETTPGMNYDEISTQALLNRAALRELDNPVKTKQEQDPREMSFEKLKKIIIKYDIDPLELVKALEEAHAQA